MRLNRMDLRNTVIAFLALAALSGAVEGYAYSHDGTAPKLFDFGISVAVMILSYLWYRRDAISRQYRGSVLLGGTVILVNFVGIPYYLFRSRPRGARVKSIAKFFGLIVLCIVVARAVAELFDLAIGG